MCCILSQCIFVIFFPKLAGPYRPMVFTKARPQRSLRPIVAFKWPGGFDGTQLSPR